MLRWKQKLLRQAEQIFFAAVYQLRDNVAGQVTANVVSTSRSPIANMVSVLDTVMAR